MTGTSVSEGRSVSRRVYRSDANRNIDREPRNPRSIGSAALLGDLFTLLDFNLEVLYYERQPVSIPYTDTSGDSRAYAPELLIFYRKDIAPERLPLLCDVMLREDLFENWKELKPKFKAARAYAREQGFTFKVLTERDICTPYLWNAKFLLQFQRLPKHPKHTRVLLDKLSELGRTTAAALLAVCSGNEAECKAMLPSLWRLVARGRVGADLTCPVTMDSPLWPLG